jgi:hypothetical protein
MCALAFGRFEPDSIVPAQFAALQGRRQFQTPEQRFWRAVLEDGIRTLQEGPPSARYWRLKQAWCEDVAWLHSDAVDVGSLRWLCDMLGLDAEAVRTAVVQTMLDQVRCIRGVVDTRREVC